MATMLVHLVPRLEGSNIGLALVAHLLHLTRRTLPAGVESIGQRMALAGTSPAKAKLASYYLAVGPRTQAPGVRVWPPVHGAAN